MRLTSAPEILSISKLIAVPTRGPAKLIADSTRSPAKAPIEGDEGEEIEEESIDAPEAQSAGNQSDQDEIICLYIFMIML